MKTLNARVAFALSTKTRCSERGVKNQGLRRTIRESIRALMRRPSHVHEVPCATDSGLNAEARGGPLTTSLLTFVFERSGHR